MRFTKCALQGLRGFHLLKNIFIVVVHMPCLVAIVDCAHVGSATASFNDTVRVAELTQPLHMFW